MSEIEENEIIMDAARYRAIAMSRQIGNWSLADDFIQEIAIHLHRRRRAFDPRRSSFKTFCNRAARDRSNQLFRKYNTKRNGVISHAKPIEN